MHTKKIRMRYPKLRELREAIRALIKGPYTSRYPKEPHIPFERFRGRPYFHEEDCIGCAACVQVCPTGALEFHDEIIKGVAKRRLTVHWDVCIFCGNCQLNCLTEKGIILSREFDFATTENREALTQHIEKELLLCECCQEPVAPKNQYAWVSQRLGPLSFANSSLMLLSFRLLRLSASEPVSPKQITEITRADRIKILCPRCLREAVLKS